MATSAARRWGVWGPAGKTRRAGPRPPLRTLSFLGVGVPPQVPSLGTILSGGRVYMQQAPWITIFPGLAIMMLVFGLNLFGDGLRDILDPRLVRAGAP